MAEKYQEEAQNENCGGIIDCMAYGGTALEAIATDSRSDQRYSVDATFLYRVIRGRDVVDEGLGRMINLSSSGILFEAARAIPTGTNVELSIPWPSRLQDRTGLVWMTGIVVRRQNGCTAVKTERYEFRLSGDGLV